MISLDKLIKIYKKRFCDAGIKNASSEIYWVIEEVTKSSPLDNRYLSDVLLSKKKIDKIIFFFK